MLTHLLPLLLLLATSLAASVTYSLTAIDSTAWTISGLAGANPSITASVGDILTFNYHANAKTVFAIHRTESSITTSDRYLTTPTSVSGGSGSLTLTIGTDVAGMVLFYEDEANATTLFGRICVLQQHCTNQASCGGPCTNCATGWAVTAGGTCGQVSTVTCPNPLPNFCSTANCFQTASGIQIDCTSCSTGYWVNAALRCQACSSNCAVGQFISAPCGVFNDIVCSNCSPCDPGTSLVSRCPGNGTTDSTKCTGTPSPTPTPSPSPNPSPSPSPSGNCTPPANCKNANCWSPTDIQCTECNRGYWVNPSLTCSNCSACAANEYISWPCEGYTDTVCSPCYSAACHPCQVGFTMDLYGLCNPQLCMIQGCGAALLDVLCREYDSSHFLCVCPGELVTIVALNATFAGCPGGSTPSSPQEIVAKVNTTKLEAFLVNNMEQILGVAIVTVNGNTFNLTVNATVPIDGMTAELEAEIARFLGGGYTAADVTVQYLSKKRATNNGEVQVSINGQVSGATTMVPTTAYLIIGLMTILSTLF